MENKTNGMAVGSLVLGILGILCSFFSFLGAVAYLVGIILGIIGLILGISAKKQQPCGMATAGIVLSIIAIVLCAISLVACVACVACVGGIASEM
ncbi:MAG TPA: hypothetical protein H9671_07560 [Firmicutes bacterium]|nr:hypothetical protein [Bacillota bacterium]